MTKQNFSENNHVVNKMTYMLICFAGLIKIFFSVQTLVNS